LGFPWGLLAFRRIEYPLLRGGIKGGGRLMRVLSPGLSLEGSWRLPGSGRETDEGAKARASLGGSWLPPRSGWETEEGLFNFFIL